MKYVIILSLLMLFSCQSESKKVVEAKDPIPKKDCFCMESWEPVCGTNGKTYGNACVADCANIKEYKPGECK